MTTHQNLRLLWQDREPLEDFQKRMEGVVQRRKGVKPYEKQMFEEGWMYIGWSSYRPSWIVNDGKIFQPESKLADAIYSILENEGRFVFDEHTDLWKPKELVPAVREICRQLNPRMQRFLQKYQGKALLLDKVADREEGKDWGLNSRDISWWIRIASTRLFSLSHQSLF